MVDQAIYYFQSLTLFWCWGISIAQNKVTFTDSSSLPIKIFVELLDILKNFTLPLTPPMGRHIVPELVDFLVP